MIENILFDMGKVVLDYHSTLVIEHYTKDPAMIRKIANAVFYSTEWMVLDCGFKSEESCLKKMLTHLDTDEEKELAALSFRDWHKFNCYPNPGMDRIVHDIKERGYHIYLFSNASIRMPAAIRDLLPNPQDYDGFHFSAEVGYVKPQKEFFERGFERFQIKPEESLFIDDLPENAAGARSAGLKSYVFDGDLSGLKAFISSATGEVF